MSDHTSIEFTTATDGLPPPPYSTRSSRAVTSTTPGPPGNVGALHDAPIAVPQTWDWAKNPKRNTGTYGRMGTGNYRAVEWRGAVFAEHGRTGDIRSPNAIIEIANPRYWTYAAGRWQVGFDVDLTGPKGSKGAYLGGPNPFENSLGGISFGRTGNIFSAAWMQGANAMHFWAGRRHPFVAGQTAELATCSIRLTPSSPAVPLLAGIGVDYYSGPSHNSTRAPGPGIQRYRRLTPGEWVDCAWLTTTNLYDDLAGWMAANGLPEIVWPAAPEPEPDPEPQPDPEPEPEPEPSPELERRIAAIEVQLDQLVTRLGNLEDDHETHTHPNQHTGVPTP